MVIYISDFLCSGRFRVDLWKLNGLSFNLTSQYLGCFVVVRNAWLTRPRWHSDHVRAYLLSFLFYSNDVRVSNWRIRAWSLDVRDCLYCRLGLVSLRRGHYLIVYENRIVLFLKIQMRRRPHIVHRLSVKFQFIDHWYLMSLVDWPFCGC